MKGSNLLLENPVCFSDLGSKFHPCADDRNSSSSVGLGTGKSLVIVAIWTEYGAWTGSGNSMELLTLQAIINAMRRRRVWAHPHSQEWWDGVVPGFDDDMFIWNFRVSRESISYICCRLGPVLHHELPSAHACE